MTTQSKQLSNPFSTGGGGAHFEAHVQASFVTLMLTGGYAPCLPTWPISEIKLQGKIEGFDTDDLIVYVTKKATGEQRKLLGQVKHSIGITQGSIVFAEVMQAAWNDFNNPAVFTKGKDVIALITGPLSATDTRNVQWLLDQALHTKGKDEFLRNVEQANFSPSKSREKLAVFQHHLKSANGGIDVADDDLYDFLNHFRLLGYDLGSEFGIVLSLLHSHISQFNHRDPQWLWSRVVDIVQTWNQDAGTIAPGRLPEDLIDAFKSSSIVQIPEELTIIEPEPRGTDWSQVHYATDLALANLAGAWDENNSADVAVLAGMLEIEYEDWVRKAREVLHRPDSVLSIINGHWKFTERATIWKSLGSRILDSNLDAFKTAAVNVLTELDPVFDLPFEERVAANLRGKVLSHSSVLRTGVADGLAILGSTSSALINCSYRKAEVTAILTIRETLGSADWRLWGSLNDQLPALAEAAPDEFLVAVENALRVSPCPFDELFAQESSGITGRNYLTGLLWALEGLAWDENYLVRVCVVLGELAAHDPGGNWSNRPNNSLKTILLPWYPQTLAPIEKREVAVKTVCREWPDVGWELIISLLPNQNQITSGSHKPAWRRTIPDDWIEGVSKEKYWQQISAYAELAVSTAGHDQKRLAELIDHFDKLTKPTFDQLLEVLSSEEISQLPENERLPLWEHLMKFAGRHQRFADAKWALDDDQVSAIEAVADKLAPLDPLKLHQRLFSDRDVDLYEENGNWEEQEQRLRILRQDAIKEVLESGGVDSVIQLADSVASPQEIGRAMGYVANSTTDTELLPAYLNSQNSQYSALASGYVWSRHRDQGWSWVDGLDRSTWSREQIGDFLSFLPFAQESWERAELWLGESQREYWSRTHANPYQTDGHLDIAVVKLLEYGRPYAAIDCLGKALNADQSIDVTQSISALLAALSSSEPVNSMDRYHIVELIKFLQTNANASPDDLFRIEWAYLPLLDHEQDAVPKHLENRLASDPEFFCEVLRLIYRSKKKDQHQTEPNEASQAIASNAWQLLEEWQLPPGVQSDGSFDENHFLSWLHRVEEICTETGHLEVGLINVGEVLIHSPADPDGLWIHSTVAASLNDRKAQEMRNGYRMNVINSRGFHRVDPTGKPEQELARQFRRKADDIENAGFQRFAATLRDLADNYERDAERIVAEHAREMAE